MHVEETLALNDCLLVKSRPVKILSGWKEIASHLHQGIRTVQRWEILGLPIHRVRAVKRGGVIAFAEELDAWEEATPLRLPVEIAELKARIADLESIVLDLKRQLGQEKVTRNAVLKK